MMAMPRCRLFLDMELTIDQLGSDMFFTIFDSRPTHCTRKREGGSASVPWMADGATLWCSRPRSLLGGGPGVLDLTPPGQAPSHGSPFPHGVHGRAHRSQRGGVDLHL